MTVRLHIEYDGTEFFGWAVQPGVRTVQGVLQEALGVVGRRELTLTVAGRTDRGVHATGQVASHAGEAVPVHAVNAILPRDVRILAAHPAPEGFDARRDAVSRTYEYRINTRRAASALEHRTQLHLTRELDDETLAACARAVVGSHDFTAFTPTQTTHRRFTRTIHEATWTRQGELLRFEIRGNAFMRNMVRALVGTMLDTARGRLDVEAFAALLQGAHRRDAGVTAPPHGLTLTGVRFPS